MAYTKLNLLPLVLQVLAGLPQVKRLQGTQQGGEVVVLDDEEDDEEVEQQRQIRPPVVSGEAL